MRATFNLIDQPWIPCLSPHGNPRLLGLRQVLLEAHKLVAISAETPPDDIALLRLLLAVLHAAYRGPRDTSEWQRTWRAGKWDEQAVENYLARVHQRFDLFGAQHPFYQRADPRVRPKSIAALRHEFASGNNATLFDHSLDDQPPALSPAAAARALVTTMSFGLSGLSGLAEKFTAAPCAGAAIFLAQGSTLFETLALNWTRYDDEDPIPQVGDDKPAWERDDPYNPARTQPLGYLDYLTWQNRRVLLLPREVDGTLLVSEVTVAPGLRLDGQGDPMKHWTPNTEKDRPPAALRFLATRDLWRDSVAILEAAGRTGEAPLCVNWISTLVESGHLDKATRRTVVAAGMASDQAKVLFYRAERLPLPLAYLSADRQPLLVDLRTAINRAEAVSKHLWGAAQTLARDLLVDPAATAAGAESKQPRREDLNQLSNAWQIEQRYWSRLNDRFMALVTELPSTRDSALLRWHKHLYSVAVGAFDAVSEQLGFRPKSLHAWVNARRQLLAGLRNVLPPAALPAAMEEATQPQQEEVSETQ